MAFWNRRRTITAAAQDSTLARPAMVGVDPQKTAQPWQERARFFASRLGVVSFANGLLADLAARCTLRPEWSENGRDWTPRDDPNVQAVLDGYRGERDTQQDLMYRHVWLYATVGEAMQIVHEDRTGRAVFTIRDPASLAKRGDSFVVKDTPNGRETDGTAFSVPTTQVRRLWVPDPTWPGLAESPLHGAIDDCERYWALGRSITGTAVSTLVRNGILYTPSEAHTPLSEEEARLNAPYRSLLEKGYIEMARATLDDDAETAVTAAPLLVNWPFAFGPPKYVDMQRPWDAHTLGYRQEALEGIARSHPLPAQLLITGPGAVNHWGDWKIAEDASQTISGRLERVAWEDVTDTYFRPTLRVLSERGVDLGDPERWRVGFDLAAITVHPDLSAMAMQLYEWGAIGLAALLRETRFDIEQDAPTPEDFKRLAYILSLRRPGGFGGPGLPADGATTREGPPVGASLRPFPAEQLAWAS